MNDIDTGHEAKNDKNRSAIRIAGIYLLIGIFWILFSDQIAAGLAPNEQALTVISMVKGWAYVMITAVLLYWLIRREITAMQAKREEIRLSEGRFRTLIDEAPLAIAITRGGKFLYVNPMYQAMHGISSPAELIGQPVIDRVAPHNRQESEERSELRNRGLPVEKNYEYVGVRKDGSFMPVLASVVRVNLADGSATIGFFQDITERKRTEQALIEAEALYRTIFNASPDGITVTDLEGNITSISGKVLELFGLDQPDDVLGHSPLEFIAPPDRERGLNDIRNIFESVTTDENEYILLKKTGESFIGEINAAVLRDASGNPRGMVAITRDITARKQAAEKLNTALEEKETLLREVHHRVKNNLQAIIALMQMQSSQVQDASIRLFLQELEGQARTMALVYEQLYQSENLAHVAMAPYLDQLANNILDTFGAGRAIRLALQIEPILMDVTRAMPCGLIVNELVTNSLKHAFPPGFIGQPVISIALCREQKDYHLTVSDNGAGLPPGLDWQTAKSLGLRLVNLWATHQLGGSLVVSSIPPGTTIAITFSGTEADQ